MYIDYTFSRIISMSREITKGDYSSAQHQRICFLESKLEDLLKYENNPDMKIHATILAYTALNDGNLYHENYAEWLTENGY